MEAGTDIWLILLTAGGIGLVIFVHELGHYLAARLTGVRVETFSIGFGPRLIGWKRGATTYQLALLPLGGYCRMAGEEPGGEGPPQPDELQAKSVGQRFLVYSGGVLANVAFGLIVFPIVFRLGVPFDHPTIGRTAPGGPAWHAGIPDGAEVVSVNGNRVFDFSHIPAEAALGPRRATIVVRSPETGADLSFELEPVADAGAGIRSIGVAPDIERAPDGSAILDVQPGSSAWDAGVRSGDRLVEVVGGVPGLGLAAQIGVQGRSGERPLTLRIAGEEGTRVVEIPPRQTEKTTPPLVGIAPPRNHVFDVRDTPLVAASGIQKDDRLLSVQGIPILELGDLRRALTENAGPLVVEVRRGEADLRLESPPLSRAQALELADSLAVTEDVESTEIVVQPGQPAERAGLRTGDRVRKVDGAEVSSWSELQELVRRASHEERAAVFEVARTGADGVAVFATIAATPEARAIPDWGLRLRPKQYVYRADSIPEAIGFGAVCSWKFLQDCWLTLKRMMTQQLSAKNLGGIITIGAVSYSFAEAGWAKLFFFLCMLSINLAFLNVLPIPVLDGGHLFFLIVEKIKGSPVSERVLGYSQMVGVVLILSLMVYVTYNDLMRWVFRS